MRHLHREDPNWREMNLAIFRGEDPKGVLWQPRLEFWYDVNRKRGMLPPEYRDASLLDIYDDCMASVRYFTAPLRVRYHSVHVREEWLEEKRLARYWETPLGTLREVVHYDAWGLSAYHDEYKVKQVDDLRVLEYIVQDEEWWWDKEAYEADLARVGTRGVPQFYFRRSPLQGLFIEHMGFERTIYAMHDYPEKIAHYMDVAEKADDALYELLCSCPAPILNLGENIDAHMDPPPIWNDYLVPYYRHRVEQLHAAGKFVHIHVDGAMGPLLPHLQAVPWDGIEAATPKPQGDVTIEEIKEALGSLVLLDGIPAVYFLPSYPEDVLTHCVERIVELFYPRLVLGISDEIPPDGDIRRVKLVGEMVRDLI
ncbi:MAG: hypothetical protein J7M34_11000 [Anaerolineae bacterium]|nr:hypothetical protein [Anaerolineae bacterium]